MYLSWSKHLVAQPPACCRYCPSTSALAVSVQLFSDVQPSASLHLSLMQSCSACNIRADLTKYMEKTASNSGGSSSGSHTTGVIGSSVAPQAYGVQYMQQPTAAPTQTPSLSQGKPHDLFGCSCILTRNCPKTKQQCFWLMASNVMHTLLQYMLACMLSKTHLLLMHHCGTTVCVSSVQLPVPSCSIKQLLVRQLCS